MPPFHERMARSILFFGLWNDWMSLNISMDLATLKRSFNLKRFLLLRDLNMLLHSVTSTGVICNTPTDAPLVAFGLPLLSTLIIALITGFQSKVETYESASLPSAACRGIIIILKTNNNTPFNNFSIITALWDLAAYGHCDSAIEKLMLRNVSSR